MEYSPPKDAGKDDETGDALEQREDDKPAIVQQRLDDYEAMTAPLIDFYKNKASVHSFAGTESDVIYVSVEKTLKDIL